MLKEKERRVAATDRGAYVLRTYQAKVPRLNEFFGKLQPQQVTSKLWDEYVLLRLTTGKPKLAEIHRHGLPRKISGAPWSRSATCCVQSSGWRSSAN